MKHTRKTVLLGTALLALTVTLTSCAAPASAPTAAPAAEQTAATATQTPQQTQQAMGVYQVVTAQEAKKIMDSEKDVTVLDVREPSEYSTGHIPGAKLLPLGDIPAKAATELSDLNAKILVYCRSGRRSKIAADELISLGYTNVIDMGGIIDWPYDVVTD